MNPIVRLMLSILAVIQAVTSLVLGFWALWAWHDGDTNRALFYMLLAIWLRQ